VSPAAVRVTVPATSANLGPGFDALGLALAWHDEVTVAVADGPGVTVDVVGEGEETLPRDDTHLVVRALAVGFEAFGAAPPGLAVRCVNRIPQSRGLGSSAAAIVAGVLAARALAGGTAAVEDALAVAADLEGHPDNVAAALLGGLTVAWTEAGAGRAVRLEPAEALTATVFVPDSALDTATARGLLPPAVPHADAAHAAGRAALAVAALTTRPELLLPATEDRLHQGYRAPAMRETAALVARLRAAGVAAVVSGAGPTVLALSAGPLPTAADTAPGRGWTARGIAIDRRGSVVVEA
jgi:homoserine kinase